MYIFKREEKQYFSIVCHYIFIANWSGTKAREPSYGRLRLNRTKS